MSRDDAKVPATNVPGGPLASIALHTQEALVAEELSRSTETSSPLLTPVSATPPCRALVPVESFVLPDAEDSGEEPDDEGTGLIAGCVRRWALQGARFGPACFGAPTRRWEWRLEEDTEELAVHPTELVVPEAKEQEESAEDSRSTSTAGRTLSAASTATAEQALLCSLDFTALEHGEGIGDESDEEAAGVQLAAAVRCWALHGARWVPAQPEEE
eukprot:CAMPEP_0179144560 /NCGR_PEP_ID=MMETSP0796-20121207/69661_1 /TAXON_ID=73915 /ORGANISM="Pyrodinium bahamense, Strain pbaha01" /LENGTH=214 /DNA_ID=CAMNT_0020844811 /DNA_START=8 /DNA_END=652 /DNA_ORIENTATION=-